MKKYIVLITLLILMVASSNALAGPASQGAGGEAYTVQADDWLSKIALKYYGDMFAYPAIVESTNAKAAEDNSYTAIENPDLIEIGQKLWIPDGGASASTESGLTGQVWYWQTYQDTAEINNITVADPTKYSLEFLPDGSYQLVADCNRGGGGYQLDGSSLTLGPGPMTLAACEPESLFDDYVSRLGDVVTFVFADGMLVLNLKADAGNMVFSREATSMAPESGGLAALKNAQYQGIYDEPVQLTAGLFEGQPFVPGGASRPTVIFIDPFHAFGDLNGDGVEDAAVTLAENSGGSGTFVYLAAVAAQNDQMANVATLLLGDRVQLDSIVIEAGEIVITSLTHADSDPMCCPSQETVKRYRLQDGES